jgi:hypothetical protein
LDIFLWKIGIIFLLVVLLLATVIVLNPRI